MGIIFYSTGCPKCKVLKKKLEEKGIKYTENTSVDEMLSLGISQVPAMKIGGTMMNYTEAVEWLEHYKEGV